MLGQVEAVHVLIDLVALLVVPAAGVSQDKAPQDKTKIYRQVPNDAVEKVLQALGLKYQKDELKGKANTMFFDFKRGDNEYRLYNYGTHLWIESAFDKKLSADGVNQWNANAKFSRLVMIEPKDAGKGKKK